MIFGADISTLTEVESLGGKFFACGHQVDLVEHLVQKGVSSVRLRLWVDPYGEKGEPYMGGTCDLACVEAIARRAKAAGMTFLLDLHYSDFWCDPARQLIPKSWQGLSLDGLCQKVYEFTRDTLVYLKERGLEPEAVQVGNEITNGMLWPVGALRGWKPREGFDALAKLLLAGTKAVREYSGAKIVLHLERSYDTPVWVEWLDAMVSRGVPFDVIGASYYPYWHGSIAALQANLTHCIHRYGKEMWVVETAYPFTTEHFDPESVTAKLCISDPEKRFDGTPLDYPVSIQGQADFLKNLLAMVADLPEGLGKAVYWWEPGWLPVPGTSWASSASLRYCGEEEKLTGNEWANQCLFDYSGNALPALDVLRK